MLPSDELNSRLKEAHPIAHECLSALGRRLYFPRGVPAQSAEAARCPINATIGQFTDGRGRTKALPAIAQVLTPELSLESAVLYPAQGGVPELRDAWAERLRSSAGDKISRPLVTAGLTQGLSCVADLFVDDQTDVIVPDPCWGNYNLIFGVRRGGNLIRWSVMSDNTLNVDGLAELLRQRTRKTVVILNFPSNPLGYAPTTAEARALVSALSAANVPVVALADDAYLGMVWDADRHAGSLFDLLVAENHSHVLPIKVDGATKEFFFFGGRVGFLTFGVSGDAANVLEDKGLGALRSTTSTSAAPSQALVLRALRDPDLAVQRAALTDTIAQRYYRFRDRITAAGVPCVPFNSAFFALLPTKSDPEVVRQALLKDGVGVVSFSSAHAIRVSYASVAIEDIDELVDILAKHLAS